MAPSIRRTRRSCSRSTIEFARSTRRDGTARRTHHKSRNAQQPANARCAATGSGARAEKKFRQAKLAEAGVQGDKRIGERISGTILEVSIRNDDRTLRVRIGTTPNPLTKYIEDDRRNQSPYCDPSQSRNLALFGRAPVIEEVNPDRTTLEARAFLPDAYCELSTMRFRLSSPALKIPL